LAPLAITTMVVKTMSQSRTALWPQTARKRFRNLKCGARIQRGFTYWVSDNFKIICG
jgi:hypothetical protein